MPAGRLRLGAVPRYLSREASQPAFFRLRIDGPLLGAGNTGVSKIGWSEGLCMFLNLEQLDTAIGGGWPSGTRGKFLCCHRCGSRPPRNGRKGPFLRFHIGVIVFAGSHGAMEMYSFAFQSTRLLCKSTRYCHQKLANEPLSNANVCMNMDEHGYRFGRWELKPPQMLPFVLPLSSSWPLALRPLHPWSRGN